MKQNVCNHSAIHKNTKWITFILLQKRKKTSTKPKQNSEELKLVQELVLKATPVAHKISSSQSLDGPHKQMNNHPPQVIAEWSPVPLAISNTQPMVVNFPARETFLTFPNPLPLTLPHHQYFLPCS